MVGIHCLELCNVLHPLAASASVTLKEQGEKKKTFTKSERLMSCHSAVPSRILLKVHRTSYVVLFSFLCIYVHPWQRSVLVSVMCASLRFSSKFSPYPCFFSSVFSILVWQCLARLVSCFSFAYLLFCAVSSPLSSLHICPPRLASLDNRGLCPSLCTCWSQIDGTYSS